MINGDDKWLETLRSRVEGAPAELPEGGAEALCADVARLRRRRAARFSAVLGSAAAAALAVFLMFPGTASEDDALAEAAVDCPAVEEIVPAESVAAEPESSSAEPVAPAVLSVGQMAAAVLPSSPVMTETPSDASATSSEPIKADVVPSEPGPDPEPAPVQTQTERRYAQAVGNAVSEDAGVPRRRLSAGLHLAFNEYSAGQAGLQAVSTAEAPGRGHSFRTASLYSGYRTETEFLKPLNLGVNLSVPLSRILSLETGLTYSYHKARKHNFFNSYEIGTDRQDIHFVGVPLGLRLTAFQARRSSVYVYAGLMTQKCVCATWNGSSLSIDPVVLSSHLSAGYQFALSDFIGLYIEPGASHYDVSGDAGYTIYSQSPWQFELRAGLRFTM